MSSTGRFRYDFIKLMQNGDSAIVQVEGALQLTEMTAPYTASGDSPPKGESFTLGDIFSDQTITFLDLDAGRDNTIMVVRNKNSGYGAWLVAGNVLESSDLTTITELETGTHIFTWDEADGYWARLSTSSSSSSGGGAFDGTMDS